jgi:hypothetical protein
MFGDGMFTTEGYIVGEEKVSGHDLQNDSKRTVED